MNSSVMQITWKFPGPSVTLNLKLGLDPNRVMCYKPEVCISPREYGVLLKVDYHNVGYILILNLRHKMIFVCLQG